MKALVIADRNPDINFAEVIQQNGIDIVITLGDLERHDLLGLTLVGGIPKIGVYGNHCSGNYMDEIGIVNMHNTTWEYKGLSFGGIQGSVRYKDNPDAIMFTQEEASGLLADFPGVDVFISHCPPRGINDEDELAHQGFEGLRRYIERTPPKVLLHGHTYPSEDSLVTQHGPTKIEYVYKWRIVDLPDAGIENRLSEEDVVRWFREMKDVLPVILRRMRNTGDDSYLSSLIALEMVLDQSRDISSRMGALDASGASRIDLQEALDLLRKGINEYPDERYRKSAENMLRRIRGLSRLD